MYIEVHLLNLFPQVIDTDVTDEWCFIFNLVCKLIVFFSEPLVSDEGNPLLQATAAVPKEVVTLKCSICLQKNIVPRETIYYRVRD